MTIKIEGKLIKKFATEQKSEKYSEQRFWVQEMDGQYPNTFEIISNGKTLGVLDGFSEGDNVVVDANLNGKHFNGAKGERVFVSINLWKINKVGGNAATSNKVDVVANPIKDGLDLPF
jgi:hypothetical protein